MILRNVSAGQVSAIVVRALDGVIVTVLDFDRSG